MIRTDIVNQLVERASIPRAKAFVTVDAALEALKQALAAGDRIELRGFGVFEVKRRKYGVGRNPKTGVQVPILPGNSIRFRLGKRLREFRDGGYLPVGEMRSPAAHKTSMGRRKAR
jgi:nucleoid DNA-binding protein